MNTSLKMASLAALTAATLALPVAAAADMRSSGGKCQPKAGMTRCRAKADAKCAGRAGGSTTCGPRKCAPKCAVKCAPKCAAKCAPKN